MKTLGTMFALAMSLLFVGNLLAADEKKPERPRPERPMLMRTEMFKELNLTDEQKSKIEAVQKEYAPKTKELREKMDSILTEDQKKARKEAIEAAKTADKKRGEAYESIRAAVKLTDEQKAKRGEVMKEMERLHKELREKVAAILTPEQKEKMQKALSARPERARGPKPESK